MLNKNFTIRISSVLYSSKNLKIMSVFYYNVMGFYYIIYLIPTGSGYMKSGNIGTGGFGKAKHRYFAQKKGGHL